MPREYVSGDAQVYGSEGSARSILEVEWNRRGFVQIGSRIVYAVDTSTDYIPTEEEHPGLKGAPIRGMYLPLDRDAINKLIRDLRRARDQAFGRDE